MATQQVENLVIIGSGPAGYTAAIYASRASLKPILFEGLTAGGVPGGQLMTTTEVENFPGFPEGISGPELMQRMRAQALRWGTECYTEDVVRVDLTQRPFTVVSAEREVKAHSVIIATGATAKRLGLPGEQEYWNKGISACAICDGASPLYAGQEVVVIGGGDSAAEEAVYLTKYASKVHLLIRKGEMRASKAMQERVLKNAKVEVHWHTEAQEVLGDGGLMSSVKILQKQTGMETELAAKGLFYAIGHRPNTKLFEQQIELDEVGYVTVTPGTVATSVSGVYAAGDVQDHEYRQAVSAAGTGCMAALASERWLSEHDLIVEHQLPEIVQQINERTTAPEVVDSASTNNPEADFDLNRTRHAGGYALRKLFHESDRLIMVKYVSPTCGPCKILSPILDKVVQEYDSQVHFVEIDIVAEPDIAQMGQVTGTPTVQLFRDQELLQELKGVKQKAEYRQTIESFLPASV